MSRLSDAIAAYQAALAAGTTTPILRTKPAEPPLYTGRLTSQPQMHHHPRHAPKQPKAT